MSFLAGAILAAYLTSLAGLFVYGLHRLVLACAFLRRRPAGAPPAAGEALLPAALPAVTVQLPIFNEICVLDRLVEAVCALRYPRSLLEIQILDDSTDATSERARALAEAWRGRGVDVVLLQRSERRGFKAGALAEGLARARGELIAVFDADFVPPPDFLEKVVPRFADPEVGMVQARWGHLNRDASSLTRAQALLLDGHFVVEQSARAATGRFFNFNGTAGVFRRECIEAAGGWQADTLTEDLDISYRAQMAGWRFVFLDDLVCPAELPSEMNALRSQQHRWAKGSIQTAMKVLPRLLRSSQRPAIKIEAVLHLTNNAAYLLLLAAALLIVPSLAARRALGWTRPAPDLLVLAAGTGSFAFFCLLSQRRGRGLLRAAADLPGVMILGAGLSLNNALAVIEALAGVPSGFRRTPKAGAGGGARRRPPGAGPLGPPPPAYSGEPTRLPPAEALLAAWFGASAVWAARSGLTSSVPFLLLFAAGFGYVSGLTRAQEAALRVRAPRPRGLAPLPARGSPRIG